MKEYKTKKYDMPKYKNGELSEATKVLKGVDKSGIETTKKYKKMKY